MHDEAAIFEREVAAASAEAGDEGFDSYAFAISFKAVLLEGLEVAFIAITFGANQGDVPLAAAAAIAAVVVAATAALAALGWAAWWLTPVATLAILRGSGEARIAASITQLSSLSRRTL